MILPYWFPRALLKAESAWNCSGKMDNVWTMKPSSWTGRTQPPAKMVFNAFLPGGFILIQHVPDLGHFESENGNDLWCRTLPGLRFLHLRKPADEAGRINGMPGHLVRWGCDLSWWCFRTFKNWMNWMVAMRANLRLRMSTPGDSMNAILVIIKNLCPKDLQDIVHM